MKKRKIVKYSENGDFIEIFDSIREACLSVGLNSHSGIIGCCLQKEGCNLTKGFQWRYYQDNYMDNIGKAIRRGEKFKELYGKNSSNGERIRNKRSLTSLTKYGTTHPMKSDSIKEKLKNTSFNLYGVDNPSKSDKVKNKIAITERSRKTNKFINEYVDGNFVFISITDDDIINLKGLDCGHEFYINRQLLIVRRRAEHNICTICNPVDSNQKSEIETTLTKKLAGIKIENNVKNLVDSRHEVDLYLSEYKIGIEVNGSKFHSEMYGKGRYYHLKKMNIFNDAGIRLFNFFDDEINEKIQIVESMVRNSIGLSNRIFARKCEIKRITNRESLVFLESNHIQGKVNSEYSYGLYHDGILVSVMTFGQLRSVNGKNKEKNTYELIRFCNIIGTSVVGGASRLLNKFIKDENPDKIVTYANRRWSEGNLYEKLGFKFSHFTDPGYYYFYKNKRVHRYKLRKSELIKMGYDKNLTSTEILESIGVPKIWDCGNICYEMDLLMDKHKV